MTDLAPLHRRLRRALDLSALLAIGALAPACASTPDQDAGQGKTEVTKTEVTKGDPIEGDPIEGDSINADSIKPEPPKPEPTEPEPPKPEPTITITKDPPKPDPLPIGRTPTVDRLPRCPTVDWCGTRVLVEAMRPTRLASPPPDAEGCPSVIQRQDRPGSKVPEGHDPPPMHTIDTARLDVEATQAKRTAGDADTCCYEWTVPCPGGRPLLIEGRPWIAGLQPGRGWSAHLPDAPPTPALPHDVRERIAEGWLRDALTEHASIASFARARAELEAIAAPPELLRACERAAEDEVEHARFCFALAERWSGRSLEPTALPEVVPRGGGAIAVALDTFVEGCVGETIAAACARRAAGSATDPVVRAVLERIADDETEHAALAWRTLAWLTQREGARVLTAILRVAAELRPQPVASPADTTEHAALMLAHGRLDARTLANTRALAWRDLVDPLLAELQAAAPGMMPQTPNHGAPRMAWARISSVSVESPTS